MKNLGPYEEERKKAEAPLGFEPRISCLQDRRFNQLSHGAHTKTYISTRSVLTVRLNILEAVCGI